MSNVKRFAFCVIVIEISLAKKANKSSACQGKLLDCCIFADRLRIIVRPKWRFGVMSCLKGNCLFGDDECENGKSDRTYGARFTQ